jgi:hypothetical protein
MTVPASKLSPITKAADAEALLNQIGETMVALVQVFEDETRLVRAGQLKGAADLAVEKTNLAARYLREIEYMKANARFICDTLPELIDEMRCAYESFREILSRKFRIVATAQPVEGGVVRSAVEKANRRSNPHGYHSVGGTAPTRTTTRPILVAHAS